MLNIFRGLGELFFSETDILKTNSMQINTKHL